MDDLVKQFDKISIKTKLSIKDVKKALTLAIAKGDVKEALQWGLYIGLSDNERAANNLWDQLLTLAVEYISIESIDCVIIVDNMKQKYYDQGNKIVFLCYTISVLCCASKSKLSYWVLNSVKHEKNKDKGNTKTLYDELVTKLKNKDFYDAVRIAHIIHENGVKDNEMMDKIWFRGKFEKSIKCKKYVDHLVWCAILTVCDEYNSGPYPSIWHICNIISKFKLSNMRNERTKLFWTHCIAAICFRDFFPSLLLCTRKRKPIHNCWYAKRVIEASYKIMKYNIPNNLNGTNIVEPKGNVLKKFNEKYKPTDKMVLG